MTPQKITVLILLLVLIGSAGLGVWWWMGTSPSSPTVPAVSPAAQQFSRTGFDLSVLQRPEYKNLDAAPIQDGALPVQPPSFVGKTNPFL